MYQYKEFYKFLCKKGYVKEIRITDMLEQQSYVIRARSRKGGYDNIVRQMVIAASFYGGEFCDSVL